MPKGPPPNTADFLRVREACQERVRGYVEWVITPYVKAALDNLAYPRNLTTAELADILWPPEVAMRSDGRYYFMQALASIVKRNLLARRYFTIGVPVERINHRTGLRMLARPTIWHGQNGSPEEDGRFDHVARKNGRS